MVKALNATKPCIDATQPVTAPRIVVWDRRSAEYREKTKKAHQKNLEAIEATQNKSQRHKAQANSQKLKTKRNFNWGQDMAQIERSYAGRTPKRPPPSPFLPSTVPPPRRAKSQLSTAANTSRESEDQTVVLHDEQTLFATRPVDFAVDPDSTIITSMPVAKNQTI